MFEDSRQTDDLGIPLNLFGPVYEMFYATVGRVTMVAALIDIKMLELLEGLCDNTHGTFNDRYGQELEELVKKATSFVSQKLGDDVGKMLNEDGDPWSFSEQVMAELSFG